MTRREQGSLKIPISSMIDVVFLLIIFFVITAELESDIVDDQVQLADSYYVEPTTPNSAFTINIRSDDGNGGTVYTIDGMVLTLDQVVERAQRASYTLGDSINVVLRADADMEYGKIDRLTRELSNIGLYRIQHTAVSQAE